MGDTAKRRKQASPLFTEHLLLGATFGEGGVVRHYESEGAHPEGMHEGEAFLTDVSHVFTLLMAGEPSRSFAEVAFAGQRLDVGSCEFEAVLTGVGSVVSIPLLARTGNREYVAFDLSARSEALDAWLSFIKGAEQDGYAPYAALELENATRTHVVLSLCGLGARAVLEDYVGREPLPQPGTIVSCHLDRIPCVILSPRLGEIPCYMILVPPQASVALWRSLLSFPEVSVCGTDQFTRMLSKGFPLYGSLGSDDAIQLSAAQLVEHGVMRKESDFIGSGRIFGSKGEEVRP
ncbi:MAG: hypothetical protein IKF78_12585 [Atopobiaceae bacterium]|nr:hypothetical protein [Atopobiaceae bacterium]